MPDHDANAPAEVVRALADGARALLERCGEAATLDLTTTPPARHARDEAGGRRTE